MTWATKTVCLFVYFFHLTKSILIHLSRLISLCKLLFQVFHTNLQVMSDVGCLSYSFFFSCRQPGYARSHAARWPNKPRPFGEAPNMKGIKGCTSLLWIRCCMHKFYDMFQYRFHKVFMSKNVCLPVKFFTLLRKAQDHITHLPQLNFVALPRKKNRVKPSSHQLFSLHPLNTNISIDVVHTTLLPYRSSRVKHLQDAITPFTL